jgi:uncharacterized cupin superfamily protein
LVPGVPGHGEMLAETTGGGVAVLEHLAARGAGSPLHVHRLEEEWFYVLEGELTLWVGGHVIDAPTGAFVDGPRGIAHTFIVRSERARFLLVTQPAVSRSSCAQSLSPLRSARSHRRGPSQQTWRR